MDVEGMPQPQQPAPGPVPTIPVVDQSFRAAVKKPEPFNGNRDHLYNWTVFMEIFLHAAGVHDQEHKVLTAASYLVGDAATWWRITMSSAAVRTWDAFKTRLYEEFAPENVARMARKRLSTLKQRTSVDAYNREYRTIIAPVTDMTEADKLHYYVTGLKLDVAMQVEIQRPQTVTDAMHVAHSVDSTLFHLRSQPYRQSRAGRQAADYGSQRNDNARSYASAAAYEGPVPMELGAMHVAGGAKRPAGRNARSQQERERLMAEGKCFFCKKTGHVARACPDRYNARGANRMEAASASGSKN
jgi:hypothetical protein